METIRPVFVLSQTEELYKESRRSEYQLVLEVRKVREWSFLPSDRLNPTVIYPLSVFSGYEEQIEAMKQGYCQWHSKLFELLVDGIFQVSLTF